MQQKHFFVIVFIGVFFLFDHGLFANKKDDCDKSQELQNKNKDAEFLLFLDEMLFLEELKDMEKKEEAEKQKSVLQEKKLSKSFKNFQEKIGKHGGILGAYSLPVSKKNNLKKKKFSLDAVFAYDPKGEDPENKTRKKKRKFVKKFSSPQEETTRSHEPLCTTGGKSSNENQDSSSSRVNVNQKDQIVFFEEDLNDLLKITPKK